MGGYLYEEVTSADLKKSAMPEELLRCIEEKQEDGSVKKISLMYRRDVPQFRTAFFSQAMNLYQSFKLFNSSPPNGQGWANERHTITQILSILSEESQAYEAWEHDKMMHRK